MKNVSVLAQKEENIGLYPYSPTDSMLDICQSVSESVCDHSPARIGRGSMGVYFGGQRGKIAMTRWVDYSYPGGYTASKDMLQIFYPDCLRVNRGNVIVSTNIREISINTFCSIISVSKYNKLTTGFVISWRPIKLSGFYRTNNLLEIAHV